MKKLENKSVLITGQLGMRDEAAIVGEPVVPWVIEDQFAGHRTSL